MSVAKSRALIKAGPDVLMTSASPPKSAAVATVPLPIRTIVASSPYFG